MWLDILFWSIMKSELYLHLVGLQYAVQTDGGELHRNMQGSQRSVRPS